MEDRNARLGDGRENIDRVTLEGHHLVFTGKVIIPNCFLPVSSTTASLAFAAGPALHIAYGGVTVNTTDFVGVHIGPTICVETASAQPFERGFESKSVFPGHCGIERIEVLHRIRTTKSVAHINECEMETSL